MSSTEIVVCRVKCDCRNRVVQSLRESELVFRAKDALHLPLAEVIHKVVATTRTEPQRMIDLTEETPR